MRFGTIVVFIAAALALATAPAQAVEAKDKKATSKPAKKSTTAKSSKSSKTRPAGASARRAAVAAAPEPEPAEPLSDVQLVLASMVQTGRADCEFDQMVMIEPNLRQLGGFVVKFQKAAYTMVPEQTTTGAIRLVDNRAGIAWLQIRYKSMLMNMRAGQRMVDACSMPAQRMAEAEAVRTIKAAADNPDSATESAENPQRELPLLRN